MYDDSRIDRAEAPDLTRDDPAERDATATAPDRTMEAPTAEGRATEEDATPRPAPPRAAPRAATASTCGRAASFGRTRRTSR
jgi:hypothetical protein